VFLFDFLYSSCPTPPLYFYLPNLEFFYLFFYQANVSKSSSSAPPAENGELTLPTQNVVLSSCDHRYYVPTPYNSPVRRNPRQTSSNGTPPTRLRGGGPSKRSPNTPNKPAAKKIRVSINGRYNRKDLLYDDPETVIADGNSPLYEHPDLTVSHNLHLKQHGTYPIIRQFFSTHSL
jgi:hypothetical protein